MLVFFPVLTSEIVNSGTGRNLDGAALLTREGELSTLRSGGTPASMFPHGTSAAVNSIRGPGLLDERAEDLPH